MQFYTVKREPRTAIPGRSSPWARCRSDSETDVLSDRSLCLGKLTRDPATTIPSASTFVQPQCALSFHYRGVLKTYKRAGTCIRTAPAEIHKDGQEIMGRMAPEAGGSHMDQPADQSSLAAHVQEHNCGNNCYYHWHNTSCREYLRQGCISRRSCDCFRTPVRTIS